MSENISITVKAAGVKVSRNLSVDESSKFTVELAAGSAFAANEFQIPGQENCKFIAVFAENYDTDADPVEVAVDAADAYPIACTPVAILTADVVGGLSDAGAGTPPISLFFANPGSTLASVTVISGE